MNDGLKVKDCVAKVDHLLVRLVPPPATHSLQSNEGNGTKRYYHYETVAVWHIFSPTNQKSER
jgi:hypothetical protein